MAAYSVLTLQVSAAAAAAAAANAAASKRNALLQASILLAAAWCFCCTRAYQRRQGSDLRSYDALFITVEPGLGRRCGAETALSAAGLVVMEIRRLLLLQDAKLVKKNPYPHMGVCTNQYPNTEESRPRGSLREATRYYTRQITQQTAGQ